MSMPKIFIEEAVVTFSHQFTSRNGKGLDVFIEASSSRSTAYFQVVFYDNDAEKYSRIVKKDDKVRVSGGLTVKLYSKSDGGQGTSLVIERPDVFEKINQKSSDLPVITDNNEVDNEKQLMSDETTNIFNSQGEVDAETNQSEDIVNEIQTDIDGSVILGCHKLAPGYGYAIIYKGKGPCYLSDEEFEAKTRLHPIRLTDNPFWE